MIPLLIVIVRGAHVVSKLFNSSTIFVLLPFFSKDTLLPVACLAPESTRRSEHCREYGSGWKCDENGQLWSSKLPPQRILDVFCWASHARWGLLRWCYYASGDRC